MNDTKLATPAQGGIADFQSWSREVAGQLEAALADLLPASRVAPARLHDAMRYSTLGGGKRVRAMLVFAAGELTLPELELMHILKTGALIRASVLLGAHCGRGLPQSDFEHLDRYAKCVGLAFQVVDDILDEEGDSSLLGKTAGKDKAEGKPTYTSLMGLPGAKRFAAELLADANEALASFDARARRLRELATFIVQRER